MNHRVGGSPAVGSAHAAAVTRATSGGGGREGGRLKELAGAALGHPRASREVSSSLPGGPWQPHGPCNYMIKAEKEKIGKSLRGMQGS